MTDKKELLALTKKAEEMGAKVTIKYDSDGWIDTIQVIGLKGVGPHPMPAVYAAEALRASTKKSSYWVE